MVGSSTVQILSLTAIIHPSKGDFALPIELSMDISSNNFPRKCSHLAIVVRPPFALLDTAACNLLEE